MTTTLARSPRPTATTMPRMTTAGPVMVRTTRRTVSEDGDSPTDSNVRNEGRGGKGAGTEKGKPPKSMKDQIQDAVRDQLMHEEDVAEDIDSVMDALEHGRGGDDTDGPDAAGRNVEATDAARLLHREVAEALLDLKDESELGWLQVGPTAGS